MEFSFNATVEGVPVEVTANHAPYEAQTLEHPGVVEVCEIVAIKVQGSDMNIMDLLEHCATTGRADHAVHYGGYIKLLVKLEEMALADYYSYDGDGPDMEREQHVLYGRQGR